MTHNHYIYIAVMALVSYAIRILPLTLIRKPIKNRFIQSFLYYVPYVTLAVMTFPAIVNATQSPAAGAMALVVGIAAAWFGASCFRYLWPAVPLCSCWNCSFKISVPGRLSCCWALFHCPAGGNYHEKNSYHRCRRLCRLPHFAAVAGEVRALRPSKRLFLYSR